MRSCLETLENTRPLLVGKRRHPSTVVLAAFGPEISASGRGGGRAIARTSDSGSGRTRARYLALKVDSSTRLGSMASASGWPLTSSAPHPRELGDGMMRKRRKTKSHPTHSTAPWPPHYTGCVSVQPSKQSNQQSAGVREWGIALVHIVCVCLCVIEPLSVCEWERDGPSRRLTPLSMESTAQSPTLSVSKRSFGFVVALLAKHLTRRCRCRCFCSADKNRQDQVLLSAGLKIQWNKIMI